MTMPHRTRLAVLLALAACARGGVDHFGDLVCFCIVETGDRLIEQHHERLLGHRPRCRATASGCLP